MKRVSNRRHRAYPALNHAFIFSEDQVISRDGFGPISIAHVCVCCSGGDDRVKPPRQRIGPDRDVPIATSRDDTQMR